MYVISLDHYLDTKGAIAVERGAGRKMADFVTAVVAYASNPNRPADTARPACFECAHPKDSVVEVSITNSGLVSWRCRACGSQGKVSNWRGTFWDLSQGVPTK